jgi:glycosyltransferase involved in cell wall biosynthesis
MVVIDAREVAGDFMAGRRGQSPVVHPVIWSLAEALAKHKGVDLEVLYACSAHHEPVRHVKDGVLCVGVPPVFSGGKLMGTAMLGRALGLLRYLRQNPVDLVHGQGTEREAGLVAAFSGLPSLLTLHGNFSEISKIFRGPLWGYYSIASFLEKVALKKVGGIICISDYVRKITAKYKKPQFLIPNALRTEFLQEPAARANIHPPRVIYMGTFDPRKRPDIVLRICESAWQAGAVFVLGFYGGSGFGKDYQEKFKAYCQPHVEAGRVFFGGFTQEPWKIWATATIGISASQEESFGMNILEALGAGTPVIAPRVGGAIDIVRHGKCGFLYDPKNLRIPAQALLQLLQNKAKWRSFSRAARQRAGEFDPLKIAKMTERAYFKLIRATPRPR